MIKKILFILAFVSTLAFAQDIDSLLSVLESHQDDDEWLSLLFGEVNYHLLNVQASYNNNSYFAGRDVGLDQFNATLQATYSYKQFSASLAGIFYEAFTPSLQTTALSANYRLPLKFPLDLDLNYGRYFFFGDNDTLWGSYPNSLGVGIGHNATFWGASADFSLLAGIDGVAPQIMASIYGNIKLFTWKEHNGISLRPELGTYFGSELTALSTAPGTTFAKNTGNGYGPGNGQGGGQPTLPEYVTVFGLLNTEFDIYLTLTLGDMDMIAGFQYNMPHSMDPATSYAATSLFSLSVGHTFAMIGK